MEKQNQKYLKVKALALWGSPGERENAMRILLRMERDFPGIGQGNFHEEEEEEVEDEDSDLPEDLQAQVDEWAEVFREEEKRFQRSQTWWGRLVSFLF